MVLVFVILIGGALWWAWPGGNVEPSFDAAQDGTAVDPALPLIDPPPPEFSDGPPVDPVTDARTVVVDPIAPAPAPALAEPEVVDPVANEVETGDEAVGSDMITFVFDDDCWVEVRDRDGDLVHGDLGRDGDTVALRGNAPFSVRLGNATGVEVTFNGKPVALTPSAPGEVTILVVGS